MILTLKNNAAGQRTYLGGIVTVPEGDQTILARDLNVIVAGDAQFIKDVNNNDVIINNGVADLDANKGFQLLNFLANFSTDPIATLFLYYSARINIRQSDTSDVGTVVWAMRNPLASPYSVVIERMNLVSSFGAATPITGINTQRYDIIRFNNATPTGGDGITPVKMSTLAPASAVTVRQLDTGLALTNAVFDSDSFAGIACPEIAGAVSHYTRQGVCLKLAAGEGIAVRVADIAAAIGQSIAGEIVWSLR